jgi:hypothetical protein
MMMAISARDLAGGAGRRAALRKNLRLVYMLSCSAPIVRCLPFSFGFTTLFDGPNLLSAGAITGMDEQQLAKLRTIFAEIEAERKRQRSRGVLGRVRETVALFRAHTQHWHLSSQTTTRKENHGRKGERIRALCALLVKTDDPVVMENLAAQLRQAIDEYVRSADPRRSIDFTRLNHELDRKASIRPAA